MQHIKGSADFFICYLLKDGTRYIMLTLRDGSHILVETEADEIYPQSSRLDKLERSGGRSPERSSN